MFWNLYITNILKQTILIDNKFAVFAIGFFFYKIGYDSNPTYGSSCYLQISIIKRR